MNQFKKLVAPMSLACALVSVTSNTYVSAAPMTEPPAEEASTTTVTIGEFYDSLDIFPQFVFLHVDKEAWAVQDLILYGAPDAEAKEIAKVKKYEAVHVTGQNQMEFWEAELDGETVYVNRNEITLYPERIEDMKAEDARKAEEAAKKKAEEEAKKKAAEEEAKRKEAEAQAAAEEAARLEQEAAAQTAAQTAAVVTESAPAVYTETVNSNWNGNVLTPSAGVNYGPSGKETYYNLDMSGVVSIMRNMGNTDEYWVREDGAKMLGDYVMVAANLDVHPRGSLVETSLGTGIVADTGGFAYGNPTQVDIATAW